MKSEPIRVLQVVGRMDRFGIETMLMNLYRNIDREKVQFDFLARFGSEASYNDEIRAVGGRIYEMPALLDAKRRSIERQKSLSDELFLIAAGSFAVLRMAGCC